MAPIRAKKPKLISSRVKLDIPLNTMSESQILKRHAPMHRAYTHTLHGGSNGSGGSSSGSSTCTGLSTPRARLTSQYVQVRAAICKHCGFHEDATATTDDAKTGSEGFVMLCCGEFVCFVAVGWDCEMADCAVGDEMVVTMLTYREISAVEPRAVEVEGK